MLRAILGLALSSAICLVAVLPTRAADEKKVKNAIDKAVAWLKANYANDPNAPPGKGDPTYVEGGMALAGIALLEAKVPASDPVIQAIAKTVRDASLHQVKTYHLCLDIIFLDKLGEDKDTPLIQSMGARLVMGQDKNGGWSYAVPGLDQDEISRMQGKLQGVMKGNSGPPDQKGSAADKSAEKLRLDPIIREILQGKHLLPFDDVSEFDDNSNTQFALIALWSARKYGVPG